MRSVGVLLLALAIVLAGCAGDDGGSSGATDGPGASGDNETQIRNGIEGIVQSEDLLPLERAKVEIISLNLTVFTNSEGQYRFANLEPRDYLVVAEKEGFRTLTQRAIVQDETIHELNFQLEARSTETPYSETLPADGLVSCKFVYGLDPESMQHHDCGSFDPNNQDTHEFEVQRNAAQIVVEANWEPTQDGAKHMMLTVESVGFGHQDLIFGSITGPPGVKISVAQTITEKYYPEGGVIRTKMDAGPSITGDEAGLDGGVVLQQNFEVFVTVFYVEPGPPTFSALPNQ